LILGSRRPPDSEIPWVFRVVSMDPVGKPLIFADFVTIYLIDAEVCGWYLMLSHWRFGQVNVSAFIFIYIYIHTAKNAIL